MIRCLTCGKDWSEKTTGSFEVDSENGLIKCPDCMRKGTRDMTLSPLLSNITSVID